ncbi:uncharacterized protein [Haliotis asinina]|uniref:uncharacterized protein n=1 Tax=Haliotis asinina TaxID=109174 RepID=UPI0035324F04
MVNIGTQAPQTNVGIPATQINVGTPTAQISVGTSGIQTNVGTPEPQTNVGTPATQANVGTPATKTNVGTPEPQTNVGTPATQANVGTPATKTNVGTQATQIIATKLQGTKIDPAFIGETIVFECVITNDSLRVSSSSIRIRHAHSNASIGRVVNQTATSATIKVKVTSLSDAGMYYCTLSTAGGDFDLGYAWVDVDYPLAPVTDLNCTVPPGMTQLGCTYTLPLPYRHPEDILGCVYCCPQKEVESLGDFCLCDLGRHFSLPAGNSLYSTYSFQILLWHSRRNVSEKSKEFTVLPVEVVIPPPVDIVHVTERGARHLQLSWQQLDDFVEYVYRVTYTATSGNVEQISTRQTNSTEIILRELNPFTIYSILVQGRESDLATGYWSQGNPVTVRTLADAPERAPRVSPAVFGTDDGRVVVYWQPLSPGEENGEMQGYMVQCEDEEERRVGSGRFSMTLDIPSDRRGQWCNVSAVNNVGVSPTSSLYIPSRRPELTSREFWVAGGEGDANITFLWDLGGRELHNCAAYWCQAADTTGLCQAPVQWETVSCDQQNLTIDIGHVMHNQRLTVGFSAQLSAPGGPVWSSIKRQYCVYAHNKVPPAPDGFRLSPSQPPLAVHVEWRSPDCRQNPAYITSYVLSYCPVPEADDYCSDSRRNSVVDGDAVSYLIRDLEPGAIYKVNIRAVSQVLQGPWSTPVIGRVEDDASPLKIILAVTGCMSSIPVFILCFYIVKRARSSWNTGHLYSYPRFTHAAIAATLYCRQLDPVSQNHMSDKRQTKDRQTKYDHDADDRYLLGHLASASVLPVASSTSNALCRVMPAVNAYGACPQMESWDLVEEAIGEKGPDHEGEEVLDVNGGPDRVVEEVLDVMGRPDHVAGEVLDVNEGRDHVVEEVLDVNGGPDHVVGEVLDVNGGPDPVAGEVLDVNEGRDHVVEEVLDVIGGLDHVVGEVLDVNGGPDHVAGEVLDVNEGRDHVVEEVLDVIGGLDHVVGEVLDVNGGPDHAVGEVLDVNEGRDHVVEEILDVMGRPDHIVGEVLDVIGGLDHVVGEVLDVIGGPVPVVEEVLDVNGGTTNVLGETRGDESVTIGASTPNGTRTHFLKDHATVKNSEYVFTMDQADSNKSPPHSNQSYSKLTLTDESGC